MNFTNPSDFKFVTGADLEEIEIDNDIMPVRSDKSLLRGIDIAFLYEAVEERCRACNVDDGETMEFSKNISKDQINTIINRWNKLYELKDEFDIDKQCSRWLDCELSALPHITNDYNGVYKPHYFKPVYIEPLTTDSEPILKQKILDIYKEVGKMHVKLQNMSPKVRQNYRQVKVDEIGTTNINLTQSYQFAVQSVTEYDFYNQSKILTKGYAKLAETWMQFQCPDNEFVNRDCGLGQDNIFWRESYGNHEPRKFSVSFTAKAKVQRVVNEMFLTFDSGSLIQTYEDILNKYGNGYQPYIQKYPISTVDDRKQYLTLDRGFFIPENNGHFYIGLSDRTMWNI